jgi:hypothetical protein
MLPCISDFLLNIVFQDWKTITIYQFDMAVYTDILEIPPEILARWPRHGVLSLREQQERILSFVAGKKKKTTTGIVHFCKTRKLNLENNYSLHFLNS